MTKMERALFEITMKSLRDTPEDWQFSLHEAVNRKLDIRIWMANRYCATRINGPGCECGTKNASLFGWLQPWRKQVVQAAESVAISRLERAALADA